MRDFSPRPWQPAMMEHIHRLPRCGLWAGMGTGKTSAVLTSIDAMLMAGALRKPVLVVAPLRVAQSTWPDEAAKWRQLRHLEVVPMTGSPASRAAHLANARNGRAPIYTINYDNLPWLMEHMDGGSFPFSMVVADESTRLKSFRLGGGKGRRARALAAVAHKHCERWVNLTGTPSPNGLADLWGQTWFLDAGERLGRSFTAFQNRWFRQTVRPGAPGPLVPLPHAQAEIEARLADLHLTVDAADWLPVDEPIYVRVPVRLPAKARAAYKELESRLIADVQGETITAVTAAALSIKCVKIGRASCR